MLADLGLAKNFLDSQDSGITQTGIACGTPLYFSPEQAKGSPNMDIRSDVYSLGITLFHLLEGSPPFTSERAEGLLSGSEFWATWLGQPGAAVRAGVAPRDLARLLTEAGPLPENASFVADLASGMLFLKPSHVLEVVRPIALARVGKAEEVVGAALYFASPSTRLLALVPAALGALLLPFVFAKRLKSLRGELIAVAAFASLHLPLGAASGLEGPALWGPPIVWLASFAAGTFAVHAIKARQQHRDPGIVRAGTAFSVVLVMAAAGIAIARPDLRWLGVAAIVPCAAAMAVNFMPIRTKALKTLGWSLVAANLVALVVLAFAY